jgi:hypothetical protein
MAHKQTLRLCNDGTDPILQISVSPSGVFLASACLP